MSEPQFLLAVLFGAVILSHAISNQINSAIVWTRIIALLLRNPHDR